MKINTIKFLFLLILFSGCSLDIESWISDSKFDRSEYLKIVELEVEASEARDLCEKNTRGLRAKITKIHRGLRFLNLYTSGLPNNKATTEQVDLVMKITSGILGRLDNKIPLSESYCKHKTKKIEESLDNLRKSSGGKNNE